MKRLQIRVRFAHGDTAHITTKNIPNGDTRTPREVAANIVEAYNLGAHDYAPLIASVVDIAEIEPERPEPDNIKVLYFAEAALWKFNRYDDDWVAEELQPLPLQDTHPRANYTPNDYDEHEKEKARLLGMAYPPASVEAMKPEEVPVGMKQILIKFKTVGGSGTMHHVENWPTGKSKKQCVDDWVKAFTKKWGAGKLDRIVSATLVPREEDDPVNHPSHYTAGGIEAIDYMKAKATPEEFAGYLRLNALKYLSRANHKGKTLEDLKKAQWYVNRLVEEVSE